MPHQEPSRIDIYKLFDRIARRYDIFNRISSFGLDTFWRRRLTSVLKEQKDLKVLDIATGTGDMLLTLFDQGCDISSAIGIDTSAEMLAIAERKIKNRNFNNKIVFKKADAIKLNFADNEFDVVTCAFGIRNFIDADLGLKQMFRVLKPNGKVLILEFSIPKSKIIKMSYMLYLRFVIPVLGKIITGDFDAYRYLIRTIQTFPSGEDFCNKVIAAGFANVVADSLTLGCVTLYSASKPAH